MKRYRVIACATAFMMASCGLSEIGGTWSGTPDDGVWGGPIDGDGSGAGVLEAACCMTVLDYSRGYDWKADPDMGSVKCSLAVYMDGRPVMKVPVGASYEVGADPDMHRMIDMHLYTDYSTESETVIKKDGEFLFRYQGREIICGMDVKDDTLYTLGINRDGEGFSFRENGQVRFSRENGRVMGTMRREGNSICFAYCEKIRTADGNVERYYVSKGGTVSQIAVREDVVKVWDILPGPEYEVYVATLVGIPRPVLIYGERLAIFDLPKGWTMLSCTLSALDGTVAAEVTCRDSDGAIRSGIWADGKMRAVFEKGYVISAMCMSDDGVCCAMNPVAGGGSGRIYRCGETYDMPEGYVCMGNGGMSMVNGVLHVGLSSADGGWPVMWKDAHADTIRVNGYIATVSAILPR